MPLRQPGIDAAAHGVLAGNPRDVERPLVVGRGVVGAAAGADSAVLGGVGLGPPAGALVQRARHHVQRVLDRAHVERQLMPDEDFLEHFFGLIANFPAREWTQEAFERVIKLNPSKTPPGQARLDWDILCDIARRLGKGHYFPYTDAEQIFDGVNLALLVGDTATGADIKAICTEAGMFAIRDVGLYRPVLELAMQSAAEWARTPPVMIAGLAGRERRRGRRDGEALGARRLQRAALLEPARQVGGDHS